MNGDADRLPFAQQVLGLLDRVEDTFGRELAARAALELVGVLIEYLSRLDEPHRVATSRWLAGIADDIEHDRTPEAGRDMGHA